MRALFAVLLFLVACDEPDAGPNGGDTDGGGVLAPLIGRWAWSDIDGSIHEFTFNANGTYQNDVFLVVGGTAQVQREIGTYAIDSALLVTTPTSASCRNVSRVALGYELGNGVLALTNGVLVYGFVPVDMSRLGGSWQTGCWASGQFVPNQVESL